MWREMGCSDLWLCLLSFGLDLGVLALTCPWFRHWCEESEEPSQQWEKERRDKFGNRAECESKGTQ
jgi:hypothetical protein